MLQTWKSWARSLKQNIAALYLASRDPRVPKTAKVLILLVVAYALSPIDIIPDFVPILGYLDDLIVLPLGIALAIRLIPKEVWEECCQRTRELGSGRLPANRIAAVVIVALWLLGLAIICRMVWKYSSLLTVAR
ncbi:MAG TPA: YkvA family protein [Thermodesulfobacteriota bacterium]|nr:DUF1232 domain-containing protein [Deltaproteobacteria bacterium]HNU72207.1 YkvA family protein [Thermodesulfobacteriota bacterium]